MFVMGGRRYTNSLVLSAECRSSLKLRVCRALRLWHSLILAVTSSVYAGGRLVALGMDCWICLW